MLFLIFSLLIGVVQCACPVSLQFNYSQQSVWGSLSGSQCDGMRQSPIDIEATLSVTNSTLRPLLFSGWNKVVQGEFENVGYSVKFVPETLDATVTNHLGTYIVIQFHLHWGIDNTEGSEHTINGKKYAAEIHFVSLKKGYPPITSSFGDTLSVVGVLCEAADIPIKGTFWEQLSSIPTTYAKHINLSAIEYDLFLPSNLEYYHYDGSLTTPPCSEIVEWFVLKQSIQIPNEYLKLLRQTQQDANGTLLTHNFHYVQPLNGRMVYHYTDSALISGTFDVIVMLLCLAAGIQG